MDIGTFVLGWISGTFEAIVGFILYFINNKPPTCMA